MAKYSFEFKMKIVQEYLIGEGGYAYLAKKHGVVSGTNIKTWIDSYKEFGEDGLLRKRKNNKYSLEYKLNVIESYLTTETSYQELALIMGMNNPSMIASWVSKFRENGIEGLSKKQGRPSKMKSNNEKNNISIKDKSSIESVDKVKELKREILELRIENAYLKELRRLRIKESQKKKK